MNYYHGTTQKFDRFSLDNASTDAYFGRGVYLTESMQDAIDYYLDPVAPDIELKIDRLADELSNDDEYSGMNHRALRQLATEQYFQNPAVLHCVPQVEKIAKIHGDKRSRENTAIPLLQFTDDEDNPVEYTRQAEIINGYLSLACTDSGLYLDQEEINTRELYNHISAHWNYDDEYNPGQTFSNILQDIGYDAVMMVDVESHLSEMYCGHNHNHLIVFDPDKVQIEKTEPIEVDLAV